MDKKENKPAANKRVQEVIEALGTGINGVIKQPEESAEYKTRKLDDNDSLLIPDSFTGRVSGFKYQISSNQIILGDKEGMFYLTFDKETTEAFIRELQEASELCS